MAKVNSLRVWLLGKEERSWGSVEESNEVVIQSWEISGVGGEEQGFTPPQRRMFRAERR